MQHSFFGITEKNDNKVSYSKYCNPLTNKKDIDKLKQLLSVAMLYDLTQRQRECLQLYYYENKRMCEIASLLSVSPSTVTRHIKAAQKKLKDLAKYC